MPAAVPLRLGTLNLASGRGADGRALPAADLTRALAEVDVDVLAIQEVDAGQPRSHTVDQARLAAAAVGAADWRMAAGLAGTPGPTRAWRALAPPALRGPGTPPPEPHYGVALVSRRPVRRWSAVALGAGRARLPMRSADPRTGRPVLWWFPDEPRVAVAAELDGLTVVATHLSFAPVTAARQLRRLAAWAARLPGPVVLAGDLNLPGGLPARLAGATPLVRAASYPARRPRVQLDHLLALHRPPDSGGPASPAVCSAGARALAVGDHRLLTATLRVRP